MTALALHLPDPRVAARLRTALQDEHRIVSAASWDHLRGVIRRQEIRGCILDPYCRFDPLPEAELRYLRRRDPDVALVVCSDFTGREEDVYELGRLGMDGILPLDRHRNAQAVREGVRIALARALARRVGRRLEERTPPLVLSCLEWGIQHAPECPEVGDLAAALRCSPASLARRLRDEEAPTPRSLLLWARLFYAAYLLKEERETVEGTAFRLGYSTGATLARAFKERTAQTPSEIRLHGGPEVVADAFLASLGESGKAPGEDGGGGSPNRRWSRPGGFGGVLAPLFRR